MDSLAVVREALAIPGDDLLRHWRRVNLGRFIAEEHYRLTLALADAGRLEEARALLTAAVLGELSDDAANGVRELAERIAARVRASASAETAHKLLKYVGAMVLLIGRLPLYLHYCDQRLRGGEAAHGRPCPTQQ